MKDPDRDKSLIEVTITLACAKEIWSALECGLENTRSELIEHDRLLGRTTAKNRSWAAMLELQIDNMSKTLNELEGLIK